MVFRITNKNIHDCVYKYVNRRRELPSEIQNLSIGQWDVSNVTNMQSLFAYKAGFNEPLDNWDVSNVTNMSQMFEGAIAFNQPIGGWNVSNVTNMSQMFEGAIAFNQPIGGWNVSNVTNMNNIFQSATSFNQPINNWDITKVLHRLHVNDDVRNAQADATLMEIIFQGSGLTVDNYPRPKRIKYKLVELTPEYLHTRLGYSDDAVKFITTRLLTDDNNYYKEFNDFMDQKRDENHEDYFDPILHTVFIDPVKVRDQSNNVHTYERNSIITLFNRPRGTPTSPITRSPLPHQRMERDDVKRNKIIQLMNEYIESLTPPSERRRSRSRSISRTPTHNPYLALSVSSSPSRLRQTVPHMSPSSRSVPRRSPSSRSVPRGSPSPRTSRRSVPRGSPSSRSVPRRSPSPRTSRRRSTSPRSRSPSYRRSSSPHRESPPSRSIPRSTAFHYRGGKTRKVKQYRK
jgi:surface protein